MSAYRSVREWSISREPGRAVQFILQDYDDSVWSAFYSLTEQQRRRGVDYALDRRPERQARRRAAAGILERFNIRNSPFRGRYPPRRERLPDEEARKPDHGDGQDDRAGDVNK